jgi:hypothetical protein
MPGLAPRKVAAAAACAVLLPRLAAAVAFLAPVPPRPAEPMIGTANWTMRFSGGTTGGLVFLDKTPYANTLFVATGNEVAALNGATGDVLWMIPCKYNSSVVLSGLSPCGMVLYAFCSTYLMAIDTQGPTYAATPTYWETGGTVNSPGVIGSASGDYIYYVVQSIPGGNITEVYYYVQATNLATGALSWYFSAPKGVKLYGPPVLTSSDTQVVVAGDTSYWLTACCGGNALASGAGIAQGATSVFNLMTSVGGADDGSTACFSAEDSLCCYTYYSASSGGGTVRDQCSPGFLTKGAVGQGVSAPTNYAFVGTQSGDVVVSYLRPGSTSSTPVHTTPVGQAFSAPGVMGSGSSQVYMGSLSGSVVALDALSGAVMWTLAVDGPITYAGVLNTGHGDTLLYVIVVGLSCTKRHSPRDSSGTLFVRILCAPVRGNPPAGTRPRKAVRWWRSTLPGRSRPCPRTRPTSSSSWPGR